MSGPKGGSYESAEARERRLQRELRAQLSDLQQQTLLTIQRLHADERSRGRGPSVWDRPAEPAADASSAALQECVASWTALQARVRSQLDSGRSAAVENARTHVSTQHAVLEAASVIPHEGSSVADLERARLMGVASSALASLDADVDASVIAEQVASLSVVVPLAELEQRVGELITHVNRFSALARLARLRRERVARLKARLVGLDHPAKGELERRLDAVLVDPDLWSDGLEALTERVVDEGTEALDRVVTMEALVASLGALGYSVGPQFEELLATTGTAPLAREGWHDHALMAHMDDGRVALEVVRTRPSSGDAVLARREDIDREVAFCEGIDGLEAGLAAAGVDLEFERLFPPGEVPVRLVTLDRSIDAAARSDEADAPRRMEADLS